MKNLKKIVFGLLAKSDPKALVFAVSFFVLIIFTSVSLVKIHSSGGMAKAQKDAEIAYNYAVEKENKNKNKSKNTNDDTLEETTLPLDDFTQVESDDDQEDNTEPLVLTQEQIEFLNGYFQKSAFIGDSVMLGFANYSEKKGDEFLGGPLFLVAGSFSLKNALSDESDAVLPTFKGEKMKVEDAVEQAENIDKVFLFFGINDFNVVDDPINDVFEEYVELINRIKAKKNVEINVISTTYMLYGTDYKALTNSNVEKLNSIMQKYCALEGYGFIDIANATGDSTNGLKKEYCSDGYLHQTSEAYDVWVNVLQYFALNN